MGQKYKSITAGIYRDLGIFLEGNYVWNGQRSADQGSLTDFSDYTDYLE
jgi:hypothetical protein